MIFRTRPFRDDDALPLVEILKRNNQFEYPSVEGVEAMQRVGRCPAAVFLVAELEGNPVGLIRAVYDGSRAVVHLLSVDPDHQHRGIGSELVDQVVAELGRRGARTFSVTASEPSAKFWEKKGFTRLPVFLMLRIDCTR
jgi:ribosomal protein S18 acetylase RimI-like enzyme